MGPPLRVTWYTDPHSVWCWGCEPMVRRLEIVYPEAIEFEIRQGGLFEDFSPVREQWARMSGGRWTISVQAFFDAVSSQHRMPMDSRRMIQAVDDFRSTWPACIAVKGAELQGGPPGHRYLRALREAWYFDGRPIHTVAVQTDVARESGLDPDAFREALDGGTAKEAFLADRKECERLEVTGFPAFTLDRGNSSTRINGWQPWEVFEEALRRLAPDLRGDPPPPTEESVFRLIERFGRCATREVAAVLGSTDDDAELLLEEIEGAGKILRRPVGNGVVWERPLR